MRQHQFRWSERHQRPSPYASLRPNHQQAEFLKPVEVKESEIIPTFNGATEPRDSQIEQQKLPPRIISMLVPHIEDGIPIWVFSAGQLNVLRRMAQTQITLTHERVCPSNRLIKWYVK